MKIKKKKTRFLVFIKIFKRFIKYLALWWSFSIETCWYNISTNNCVDGLYLFEFMSAVTRPEESCCGASLCVI